MIGYLRRRAEERARLRAAERRALEALAATNAGPHAFTGIVRTTPDDVVVRVCFGDTRPPRRRWFLVPASADAPVRELSFADVVPMGEKPWR